jgi:hypothetical protein
MSKYAKETNVSTDQSEAEIKNTLKRYGANQYISGWKDGQVLIGFQMGGKVLRFVVPMPKREEFETYEHGNHRRARTPAAQDAALEQACRQRWRALALLVKAKLEAVDGGIKTFEEEFLSHIVVPGTGKTVAELMLARIDEAYKTDTMPQLGWEQP